MIRIKDLGFRFKIFFMVLFLFIFFGCNDRYIKTIYNQKELNLKKSCVNLRLEPFSNEVYDTLNNFYKFKKDCKYTLKVRYKTKIACNSPYKTNHRFNAFIEYSLLKNNQILAKIYLDTTTRDFKDDLKSMFFDVKEEFNF